MIAAGAHDLGGATRAEAVEVIVDVEVPRRGVGRIAARLVVLDEIFPPEMFVGVAGLRGGGQPIQPARAVP